MHQSKAARLVVIIGAVVLAAGCTEDNRPMQPEPNVLKGFVEGESNDTTPTPPPSEQPGTPGAFHGVVLAHPGFGPDSMVNPPRVAGVVITAYPHLGWEGTDPVVGEAAGSVTTDSNGEFQFPEIAGGNYIITFVPAASSSHQQTYVVALINSTSNQGSWWVTLQPK